MKATIYYFIASFFVFFACTNDKKTVAKENKKVKYDFFVGTYTKKEGHVDGKGLGIHHYKMDEHLNLLEEDLISELVNPSYLTLSKDGRFLYTVEELVPEGNIVSYDISGKEAKLLSRVAAKGGAPCHLESNSDNSFLISANYVGKNMLLYPIEKNGTLSVACDELVFEGKGNNARQEAPHPHFATFDRNDSNQILCADLGTDKLNLLKINTLKGKIVYQTTPFVMEMAGAGPRHLVQHKGRIYLLNELNRSVSLIENNTIVQNISTLPASFTGQNLCADIHITPDGKYLYASNRGHNSLAIYRIMEENGHLVAIGHCDTKGEIPRNFNITPDGKYLFCANQNSDTIVIFSIEKDGQLTFVKEMTVKTPVCIQFR